MLVQDQMQACDNTRSDACESGEHVSMHAFFKFVYII